MRDGLRRSALLPVLLGVFFLSVYLLSGSSDLLHNGDTYLRYQTTQALVDQHHAWIDNPMYKDTRVAWGRGHHRYAFYAPGQIVFMIPFYIAGKAIAHHLSLPYPVTTLYASRSLDLFLGALLVVIVYFLAVSMGYSRNVALILSFLFGLTTAAWPDAQSGLEQTQVDLFLLLAVLLVWKYVSAGMENRWWLIVSGTAAGLCFFTRYDAAIYLPLLGAYPLILRWVRQQAALMWGDALAFAAGVLPWALLVAGWDTLRFGSPVKTGLSQQTFGEPIWTGLAGLLVSPGKGLIWYLPLVFLIPWATRDFYRRRPSLCLLFAAIVVLTVLFYSTVLFWHGDPAWGPRYLYTTVPYLILPLGELLSGWSRRPVALRSAFVALTIISFGIQVSAISVTQWRFWYRLEAIENNTPNPFRWGASYYHYYWIPSQSPIVLQAEDLYQVIRLNIFGDRRFLWTARPTTCSHYTQGMHCPSNPADNYPINTLAFWWADVRHPLLGARTRDALALLLAGLAAGSLALLVKTASRSPAAPGGASFELDLLREPEPVSS